MAIPTFGGKRAAPFRAGHKPRAAGAAAPRAKGDGEVPPKSELDAIRARAKAKFGKNPSNSAVLATYGRNQARQKAKGATRNPAGKIVPGVGRQKQPAPPGFMPGRGGPADGSTTGLRHAPRGNPTTSPNGLVRPGAAPGVARPFGGTPGFAPGFAGGKVGAVANPNIRPIPPTRQGAPRGQILPLPPSRTKSKVRK